MKLSSKSLLTLAETISSVAPVAEVVQPDRIAKDKIISLNDAADDGTIVYASGQDTNIGVQPLENGSHPMGI